MNWREWLGGLAILEVILICVGIKTGWRWHRTKVFRRMRLAWRRITVGAFSGWMAANALGVTLIVASYELFGVNGSVDTFTEDAVLTLPIVGVGVGAFVGYKTRSREDDCRHHPATPSGQDAEPDCDAAVGSG